MKRNPVLAVWMDAMDPALVEEMMSTGELPYLARLRSRGAYGELESLPYGFAEMGYSLVIGGLGPEKSGRWAMRDFAPESYSLLPGNACDYTKAPPFYRLGSDYHVTTFDLPKAPIDPQVHGMQVTNWACHSAGVPRDSLPKKLVGKLIEKYGEHPAGDQNDHANLDDPRRIADLHERFIIGMRKRAFVTAKFMKSHQWDLFFTCISETHNAGHYFWNREDCPAAAATCGGWRMVRDLYREADYCLGKILEAAGDETTVVVFSPEGMRRNCDDVPSMVLLPELLARDSFAGQRLLEFEAKGKRPPAGFDWVSSVWSHARRPQKLSRWLRRFLPPPTVVALERAFGRRPALFEPRLAQEVKYQPLTWYQPYWRYMRAFALPTNSDGIIRLNVRGREHHGIIDPAEYDAECSRVEALLRELVDPNTGQPAVLDVIRTRPKLDLAAESTHLPPGDLVVQWAPTLGNVVTSPRHGTLGPVPLHRAGSHTRHGFICMAGPGIPAGSRLPKGSPLDVGPTILNQLGAEPTIPMEGKVLVPGAAREVATDAPLRETALEVPPAPYPKLAMVLIIKNEEHFLATHLLYHRAMGVHKAYVFLDECTDSSREILQSFPWVEVFDVQLEKRMVFYTDLQDICVSHSLSLARRDGMDWLMSIDPDEFAFGGSLEAAQSGKNISWAGNLPRMLAAVEPEALMVRMPTRELVPSASLGDAPFWQHSYFQRGEAIPREVLHPLTGERRVWSDFLGHQQGKSIVRVNAKVQTYDAHRWVADHGRRFPERPDYVPVPTVDRGFHLHFMITTARHWRDKYRKFANDPKVWPCGKDVEFPKQCWKEATTAFTEEGAVEYFNRWVGMPKAELDALEQAGKLIIIDIVRQVLAENGFLHSNGALRLPPKVADLPAPRLLREQDLLSKAAAVAPNSLELGRLSPRLLRGFHPVELSGEKLFRWAEPKAGIQLQLPAGDYRVSVHLDELMSLCPGFLGAALNERQVDAAQLQLETRADGYYFTIPHEYFTESGENWLNLQFKPVDTSSWKGEVRQLGAPLFRIELTPIQAPTAPTEPPLQPPSQPAAEEQRELAGVG